MVCGAEKTEPKYLEDLVRDLCFPGRMVEVKVRKTRRGDPVSVVKYAMKVREDKQDDVWVVIDKDNFDQFDKAFELAKRENIKIVLSSVCFELWILLHFCKNVRVYDACHDICSLLLREHIAGYAKEMDGLYQCVKSRMKDAKENARHLRRYNNDVNGSKPVYEYECYTDVDILVDDLMDYRATLIK
nr:RloB family protein [Desulfobaculum xiamenense]